MVGGIGGFFEVVYFKTILDFVVFLGGNWFMATFLDFFGLFFELFSAKEIDSGLTGIFAPFVS